ncbi:MAG: hypothetical protein KDD69_13870 [Bdellovibrionales bacterium]|nr:hypothetical protein [Bdellovibrionales bacterium]
MAAGGLHSGRHATAGALLILVLCLLLIPSIGLAQPHTTAHQGCPSDSLVLPPEVRAAHEARSTVDPVAAARLATSAATEAFQLRLIDTVIVLPSEFNTDATTGAPAAKSVHELKQEVEGILAQANEYLAEVGLRLRSVEYKIFTPEGDPYREAQARRNAYDMLDTATQNWQSYETKDYDLVLVLGRGAFGGAFGLAYPGVSCLSRQYSVVFATQAGTGVTKEVTLAQTVAHEVGHFIGMQHDSEQYPDGRSLMWPTYLTDPFGYSLRSAAEAEEHAGIGRVGGDCFEPFVSALADDADGDGTTDDAERLAGSDEFDAGSYPQQLRSPVYALWNSFLGMTNILELVNRASTPKDVSLQLLDLDGTVLHQQHVLLAAEEQTDVIVNDLPNFRKDAYGLLVVRFEGEIDGRMSFYRAAADGVATEFAFSVALRNPQYGKTAVAFNTYQPSKAVLDQQHSVLNWLTLVNLHHTTELFKIISYDVSGRVIRSVVQAIAPGGRVDIDGGHQFAGPSVVGLHQILPINPDVPYLAQLIRYGAGEDGYRFAFPLVARAGTGRPVVIPIGTHNGQDTWIELVNVLHRPVRVEAVFLSDDGTLLEQQSVILKAHEQRHFDAASLLRAAGIQGGYVSLSSDRPEALIAQGMNYYRGRDERISAMYGSQAMEPLSVELAGSYNLFLGMENWLTVLNTASVPTTATVLVRRHSSISEITVKLPANGAARIPIFATAALNAAPGTYGLLTVRAELPGSLAAELLRLRDSSQQVDLAMPTAVR